MLLAFDDDSDCSDESSSESNEYSDSDGTDELNDFFEPYPWPIDLNFILFGGNSESYDSSDEDMLDEFVWQNRPGKESPNQEGHLVHGRSINLIDFLKSRETGGQFVKERRTETLLSFFLSFRWPRISTMKILLDTKQLLQRLLYRWEGDVLIFLHHYAIKRTKEVTQVKNNALLHLTNDTDGLVPVTFIDIIDILLRNGAYLEAKNDEGDDLLLSICKSHSIYEDVADFIGLVLRRGYDLERNGNELFRRVCTFRRPVSNVGFRVLKMLLDTGMKLAEATKRDLIESFGRNVRSQANQNGIKTLELLIEHGCHVDNALLSMGKLDSFYDLPEPNHLEYILHIVDVLLENEARVSETSGVSLWSCFLIEILRDVKGEPGHLSMLELLKKCVARGLDTQIMYMVHRNLLMGFCECYNNKDLPDVVRFLCSNGTNVNSFDCHGWNALEFLSNNELADRQVVYETASLLVELGIDVKRWYYYYGSDNMLARLLSGKEKSHCCYYTRLTNTNETLIWNMLNLFLKPGNGARSKRYDSHDAIRIIFVELSQKDEYPICKDCRESHFKSVQLDDAFSSILAIRFEKSLDFAERLVEIGGPVSRENFDNLLSLTQSKFDRQQFDSLFTVLSKMKVVEPTDEACVPEKKPRVD